MHMRVLTIGVIAAVASLSPFAATRADEHRHDRGEAIECSSQGYERQRCEIPWRDAQLERQLSDTRCVRDQNWGIDRHGLWVDGGCSGRFVAAGERGRSHDSRDHDGDRDRDGDRREAGGWQPDPSWNQRFAVTCESQDNRDHFCQVDLGGAGRASLQRQISDARCVEGRTWGSNRAGIWVKDGCRGEFSIDRRWR